ncbi:MAG: hypothetical protein U0V72_10540 [Cytophagales bacterium]
MKCQNKIFGLLIAVLVAQFNLFSQIVKRTSEENLVYIYRTEPSKTLSKVGDFVYFKYNFISKDQSYEVTMSSPQVVKPQSTFENVNVGDLVYEYLIYDAQRKDTNAVPKMKFEITQIIPAAHIDSVVQQKIQLHQTNVDRFLEGYKKDQYTMLEGGYYIINPNGVLTSNPIDKKVDAYTLQIAGEIRKYNFGSGYYDALLKYMQPNQELITIKPIYRRKSDRENIYLSAYKFEYTSIKLLKIHNKEAAPKTTKPLAIDSVKSHNDYRKVHK